MGVRIFIFIIFIILELLLLSQIDNYFENEKNSELRLKEFIAKNQYDSITNYLKELADNSYRGFVDNRLDIKEAFAQRDRKHLYKLFKDDYKHLQLLGFKQVQFHLPNSDSFLRMHAPNRYGDNLTDIRYSVNFTNKYQRNSSGIETGRVLPGYRYVYPVFFNKQHVGSVEFSFGINKVIDKLESMYETNINFLTEKRLFNRKVFADYRDNYVESMEHSGYVALKNRYQNSFLQKDTYSQDMRKEIFDKISSNKLFSLELVAKSEDKDNIYKSATFLPIQNVEGTSIFYFVFYQDAPKLAKIQKDSFYKPILFSFILLIIFAIIFILIVRNEENVKAQKESKKLLDEIKQMNGNLENIVKEQVEDIRKKEQLLIQQSKLATLGEMLGNIAHQWRQPLNSISLYKELIIDDYYEETLDDDKIEEFDESVDGLLQYMSKTIDDFRNFFIPSKDKVKFTLTKSIDEILNIVNAQLKSNNIHLLVKNHYEDEVTINGYPNEFKQVVMNIISNSKDAIMKLQHDGKIQDGQIVIDLYKNENNIKIDISDNGGGIPEDIINKIFEPYFTTKFKSQGTGLGLYMAKTIVEKNMAGTLSVKNSEDGAVFTIIFS
jgi:signal transduction histidine kinase